MNAFSVRVDGLRELSERLDKLTNKVQGQAVRRSLKDAAQPMVKTAKEKVPVDEGDLKKSIGVRVTGRRGRAEAKISYGKRQFHGLFVEKGTSKMRARPFLRPAFDSEKDGATDIFKDTLRSAITAVERADG